MDKEYGAVVPMAIRLNHVNSEDNDQDGQLPSFQKKEENGLPETDVMPVSTLEMMTNIWLCGEKFNIKKWIKNSIIAALLSGYILFFIAVLLIQSSKEKEQYWCSADGFLIVITSVGAFMILYYQIFKKYLAHSIAASFSPVKQLYREYGNKWGIQVITRLLPLLSFAIFLYFDTIDDRERLVPVLGIITILLASCLMSVSPKHIKLQQVYWGIGLQIIFALLILRTDVGRETFQCIGGKFTSFLHFTDVGSTFAFGSKIAGMNTYVFSILTVVIFFGMIVSILYYYGIVQFIIIKVGWLLENTMGTTPCESMATAANIFLGQSEAPLVILPYIRHLTNSEIHAVLTGGFATVAGGVLSAYISFGIKASHLMSASIMSAPAALAVSKIVYPEIEPSKTNVANIKVQKGEEKHVLHAITNGLTTSLILIANITGSLIAFMAFSTFLNSVFNWSCQLLDYPEGTCDAQSFLGYLLMPIAWLMGVPREDCYTVGYLLGTKIILTEFVSYQQLGDLMKQGLISNKAVVITTYALCGFSSLASLGCQVAAIGSLAPTRNKDVSRIVVRAFIAGNFACYLTASVASTLLTETSNTAFQANQTVGLEL